LSHAQPSVDEHSDCVVALLQLGGRLVRRVLHAPLYDSSQFGWKVHEPGRYFEQSRGVPLHALGPLDDEDALLLLPDGEGDGLLFSPVPVTVDEHAAASVSNARVPQKRIPNHVSPIFNRGLSPKLVS
jgi:hypothetical protein